MRILYSILSLSLIIGTSCSEKTAAVDSGGDKGRPEQLESKGSPEEAQSGEVEEREEAPEPDQIGEDCVAFLRATRAVPPQRDPGVCPQCPTDNKDPEVLQFQTFKIKNVATAEGSCRVDVTIHARFNPSSGGTVSGGLVGWIPAEERKDYAQGKTPSGLRTYQVSVVYKREDMVWHPIEFERTE